MLAMTDIAKPSKTSAYRAESIIVTRDNNAHAKAGNINNVLRQSQGELILLLDADMIPKKSIARYMVDYFLWPGCDINLCLV